jgi:hypothetical protein
MCVDMFPANEVFLITVTLTTFFVHSQDITGRHSRNHSCLDAYAGTLRLLAD